MDSKNENREFSRSHVRIRVEVRLDNGVMVDGEGVDISLRGMRFLTERGFPVGKMVRARIMLEGEGENLRLEVGARVARMEATGVALEFTDVDSDSIEHLRHLVLYNAADTDQAQEEIASHIGIERHG